MLAVLINRTPIQYINASTLVDSRRPIPLRFESFYFNQALVVATIKLGSQHAVTENASIHLTDQRLVLVQQPSLPRLWRHAVSPFRTVEIDLMNVKSLKSKMVKRHIIQLDFMADQTVSIQLDFTKKIKKRYDRLNTFREYLTMVLSALASKRQTLHHLTYVNTPALDIPPAYDSIFLPPPAYSN
ncbi:hypothetical protein EC973_005579 [Apophysomyces ossiformis]|uniref:Uncharacterized protein n=1 Tax=Apophysomyces ossiformis TaxID=679940 RepID=A0A8H7ES33_9FUNG|nr:hypothetical protein EC973_005579 [Apophysomyces ossiformis]